MIALGHLLTTGVLAEVARGQTRNGSNRAVSASSPKRREISARMMAALAGLSLLGFALVAFVLMAGRFTRRWMKSSRIDPPLTPEQLTRDDWAHKPLTTEERRRLFGAEARS